MTQGSGDDESNNFNKRNSTNNAWISTQSDQLTSSRF
jgi:hypothetical protein